MNRPSSCWNFFHTDWRHMRHKNTVEICLIYRKVLLWIFWNCYHSQCMTSKCFNDTHRENTSSNKTQALMKSKNMDIWLYGCVHIYQLGTLNQLLMRDFYTWIKFSKNLSSYGQSPDVFDESILYSLFYLSWHWLLKGQFCMKLLLFSIIVLST